jgi:hypothetical protein
MGAASTSSTSTSTIAKSILFFIFSSWDEMFELS